MDKIEELLNNLEESNLFESTRNTDWVKVMIFQTETSFKESWMKNKGLYYISDITSHKLEIFKVLEYADRNNVNLLVFPELSIPESTIIDIQNWSIGKEMIIVAGSHYTLEHKKRVNKCPIIYSGKTSFSYKLFSSPDEISPIDEFGIPIQTKLNKKIRYFKNTIIGNFIVLICADHLRSDLKGICLSKYKDIDFFIVPAFQRKSLLQHSQFSTSLLMYENGFYGIYANNKCAGHSDGKSALFGISNSRQWFYEEKYTDAIPDDKLIEIQDGHDCITFEVNIADKKSPLRKQVIENPYNVRAAKQIDLLQKQFDYQKESIITKTIKDSTWSFREKHVNENHENFSVIDFSRTSYKWENLKIRDNNNEFYCEIPSKYIEILDDFGFKFNKNTNSKLDNKLCSLLNDFYGNVCNIDDLLDEVAEKTSLYFIEEANRGNLKKNRIMYGIEHISRSCDEEKVVIIDVYTTDYFSFKFMTNLYIKLKSVHNIFKLERLEDINKYIPFFNSIGVGGFIILQRNNDNIFLFSQRSSEVNCSGLWHFSYDKTFMPIDMHKTTHPLMSCLHRAIEKENGVNIFDSNQDIKYGICDLGFIFNNRLEFEICSFAKINFINDTQINSIQEMYKLSEDGIYQTISMLPINMENIKSFLDKNKATPESINIFERLMLRINNKLI